MFVACRGGFSNPPLHPDYGPCWNTKMQPLLSVPVLPMLSVPLLQTLVKESFWPVVATWPTQGASSVQSPAAFPTADGGYPGSVGNHAVWPFGAVYQP